MSCPYCKRRDTHGLYCDDDHCRELDSQRLAVRHSDTGLPMLDSAFPRCADCNAVLTNKGECIAGDCPRGD